jgi:hypothetical protein
MAEPWPLMQEFSYTFSIFPRGASAFVIYLAVRSLSTS